MKKKKEPETRPCLLGIVPGEVDKCKDPAECRFCGWNREENDRRKAYVRERSLTLCEDGKRRLILPNKSERTNENDN